MLCAFSVGCSGDTDTVETTTTPTTTPPEVQFTIEPEARGQWDSLTSAQRAAILVEVNLQRTSTTTTAEPEYTKEQLAIIREAARNGLIELDTPAAELFETALEIVGPPPPPSPVARWARQILNGCGANMLFRSGPGSGPIYTWEEQLVILDNLEYIVGELIKAEAAAGVEWAVPVFTTVLWYDTIYRAVIDDDGNTTFENQPSSFYRPDREADYAKNPTEYHKDEPYGHVLMVDLWAASNHCRSRPSSASDLNSGDGKHRTWR